MRKMTRKRRIGYALLYPLIKLVLYSLWSSCRVIKIDGEAHFTELMREGKSCIPCFWHQHLIMGAWYMRRLIRQGMKVGFLISPSVDGEIPARMASEWGAAEVVRGSKTRAGAQTLRDMYNLVVKRGVSPVTTSDGPRGPIHKFKTGDLMLSQYTQAPLIALSYAANRYWQLDSWDRFIIPKPFARIVISVAEPSTVDKSLHVEDLEIRARQMEQILEELQNRAQAQLDGDSAET